MGQIQNHVITKYLLYIILIFLLTLSCKKKELDDDYILLNKIVNMSLTNKKIYLKAKGKYPKNCLKDYYIFRYDKKKYNKIFNHFDSISKIDSARYDGKYFHYVYWHQNCINDSIINKDLLKYLIKQEDSITWDVNKISNNNIIVLEQNDERFNEKKETYLNSISKPIYSKDKKLAIVSHKISYINTELLTFKKINGEWKLINKISNKIVGHI